MNAKIMIASLVCILTSTFYLGKNENKISERKNENTINCAPNDNYGYFDIEQNDTSVGEIVRARFICEKELISSRVISHSELIQPLDVFSPDNPCVSVCALALDLPKGDYYVKYGFETADDDMEIISSLYIYSDGEKTTASALSADDARQQFFVNYVATDIEKAHLGVNEDNGNLLIQTAIKKGRESQFVDPLSDKKENIPTWQYIDPIDYLRPIDFLYLLPTKLDAIEHMNDYVYGGSGDIDVEANVVLRASTQKTKKTHLSVSANWVDELGQSHPLIGTNIQFLNGETQIHDQSTDYAIFLHDPDHTNEYGACGIEINKLTASKIKLSDVSLQLSSKNNAISIVDSLNLNFSHLFRNSNGVLRYTLNGVNVPQCPNNYLDDVIEISYNVTVYPDRSDRAAAYEMCHAETIPYSYCQSYARRSLTRLSAHYPANFTLYNNSELFVKKEDFSNFDLLNHEYSHYICESLHLCRVFQERKVHGINEDLLERYGAEDGSELAYSEGLATYLGVASQLYCASDSGIQNVGDKKYVDFHRNIDVNYDNYKPSNATNKTSYEGIESSVTAFLLKMLDDATRDGDCVTFGHQKMWSILLDNSVNVTCISDFINKVNSLYPEDTLNVSKLAQKESLFRLTYPHEKSAWTILIYFCIADLERYATNDLYKMKMYWEEKPDDVNIVVEVGGCASSADWQYDIFSKNKTTRAHLETNRWVEDEQMPKCHMGTQETFESFLNWGLTQYPAERTGLILYDHGGAIEGCCFDYNYDSDPLTTSEMTAAIENTFERNAITRKMDFIAYHACAMQVQDVAEFNSRHFDYMLASEENQPAGKWNYQSILYDVYRYRSPERILNNILASYISLTTNQMYNMSLLDLSQMGCYYFALEELASEIYDTVMDNYNEFVTIIYSCKSYYDNDTIDAVDFLEKLEENYLFEQYDIQIEAAKEAINNLVICNEDKGYYEKRSHGLALWTGIRHTHIYPESETHFYNWRSLFVTD